jgi:hypothetical protein
MREIGERKKKRINDMAWKNCVINTARQAGIKDLGG